MNDTEYKLVKKSIKGNKKAFEKLMKQYYQQIYRTAFLYVHSREDALDIVQESTYQALISVHTLRNPEYFMTWFTKIIIRCAAQLVSRRKNIVHLTPDILASVKSNDDVNIDSLTLIESIRNLKENYQTTIILFYYYDYSIKTISEIMQIPEGTVKTYLSRGKEELKKTLKRGSSHG
ncbi:sigma-70 family RNA polymerase sigma factor [Paraliobacillus sp. JSM ZJ581]|uniref:sigma-70 family RNA polymerase sigma factor n=1 Tax=Paraliobacillus sp. JSM ZJ581 TaxID=3342118 RepID=UPI0035A987DB